MTTEDIMAVALEMGGFTRPPEDSAIFVEGRNIPPASTSTNGRCCSATWSS